MREFKTGDLEHGLEAICDAAAEEPVAITDAAGQRFVLTTADDYARLTRRPGNPRQVFATGETPPEIADFIVRELAAQRTARGPAEGE